MAARPRLDHLVYAVPDLAKARVELGQQLGIELSDGGAHPGRGSRNALFSLGESSYVEVIGPDPEQGEPDNPRPFGIDDLSAARLVTWATGEMDLEARLERARKAGYDGGTAFPLSRELPDGTHLAWRVARPIVHGGDGLVPFLIDWGTCPHPALTSAKGCSLIELRALHPDPPQIQSWLAAMGVDLDVRAGATPALIATMDTPNGRVELR